MGWPSRAAMAVPATLAEAPMGVALPPISVPMERVQARVFRSTPMVADRELITGTMVAKSKGEWSSAVARQGCWHKIGSAVAVIVALIFDWLIAMILANIPGITLPFTYEVFLGPVVLVWYIVTELGSITENAGALGAPIPDFLRKAIKSLNDAVDGGNNNQ